MSYLAVHVIDYPGNVAEGVAIDCLANDSLSQ
jgi:hypothetical protein